MREAIQWEVGFAPEACRAEPMHGLLAVSLNDGSGSARVVLGAGDWRWSDLLRPRGGRLGRANLNPKSFDPRRKGDMPRMAASDWARGGLTMAKIAPALAALAGLGLAACGHNPKLTADQACQTAIYRLADGHALDIAPAGGDDLRWRLDNGRSGLLSAKGKWSSTHGWTGQPDGVSVQLSPPCGGTATSPSPTRAASSSPASASRSPSRRPPSTAATSPCTASSVTPAGAGRSW